jgi:SAM-dependent methyltransferase
VPQNVFIGRIAEFYDATSTEMYHPAILNPAVDFLAELNSVVGGGRALELGIGTGRVGLPLSQRGVDVHGIEISTDMFAQLRAKPGADRVGVTVGDFATTKVEGTFTLAFLVFNTISNLLTQDEQVECFKNVADHLEDGGCFVVELWIPELQKLVPGEHIRAFTATPERLGFDEYEVAAQRVTSHHYWLNGDQFTSFSSHHRYLWPSELDLMARLAGMTLRERWGDWDRQAFTNESAKHISVWEKIN